MHYLPQNSLLKGTNVPLIQHASTYPSPRLRYVWASRYLERKWNKIYPISLRIQCTLHFHLWHCNMKYVSYTSTKAIQFPPTPGYISLTKSLHSKGTIVICSQILSNDFSFVLDFPNTINAETLNR